MADKAAEQPTSETVSSRECPLMTLVNCTLIARRPSVFKAGIPELARVVRVSCVAAVGRCLLFVAAVAVTVAVGRDQQSGRLARLDCGVLAAYPAEVF